MAPCLSKLPSVCLEAIFSHVPLVDLLGSIGLVCTSWYSSRRTELTRRKRLVIVVEKQLESLDENLFNSSCDADLIQHICRDDGSPWFTFESLEHIKFDAVMVPADMRTNLPFAYSIMNMSHITQVICTVPGYFLPQIIRLIDHFSGHLVNLKLCIIGSSHNVENAIDTEEELAHNVTNLFACLDRVHSLRHLKLSLKFKPRFPFLVIPQLAILSRLATFAIRVGGVEDEANWIMPLLRQCGENIESIELHNDVEMDDLFNVATQLDTKFKVLNLFLSHGDDHEYDNLRLFCTRFSSLTMLGLNECRTPMTELARCLSQLTQLACLDLQINTIVLVEEDEEDGGEHGEQAQHAIVQVPSVRLLNLYFPSQSHLDSEMLLIPEIFPNLQVLLLLHYIRGCRECEIPLQNGIYLPVGYESAALAPQLAQCARLARQPFRRCTNLHTIHIDDSYVIASESQITVDEL